MSRLKRLFSASLLFFLPTLSTATSFYPQPFPKTVDQAPVIVKGKVGSHFSDWGTDPDGTKRIYTYYELKIEEVLKGAPDPSRIVFRELGGEKDGVGLHVPGAAQFETGEQAVVFLRNKNSNDFYDVQGMMLGKYSLEIDSDGSEWVAGAGIALESDQKHLQKGNKLKLEALRQIIREQNSQKQISPLTFPPVHPRIAGSPPPSSPSPDPTLLPAPQLQSLEGGLSRKYAYGLIFLALLGTLIALRSRRNGSKRLYF